MPYSKVSIVNKPFGLITPLKTTPPEVIVGFNVYAVLIDEGFCHSGIPDGLTVSNCPARPGATVTHAVPFQYSICPIEVPVVWAFNFVLSAALMLPAAEVVAAVIETTGVVVLLATLIGPVPVTPVTVPLPVPAPMVVLAVAASASFRMSKAKSVIVLAVIFPVLFREGNVLAESGRSVGAAAEAVLFTFIVLAAIFAILAFVTELVAMVAAKLPVPDPVTSPVRVMVWFPVFVPVMASSLVLSAELMLPADEVVAAEIEITGADPPLDAMGAVPVTPVTVPLAGAVQLVPPMPSVASTCPLVPLSIGKV